MQPVIHAPRPAVQAKKPDRTPKKHSHAERNIERGRTAKHSLTGDVVTPLKD
jgi:hypothetical protein